LGLRPAARSSHREYPPASVRSHGLSRLLTGTWGSGPEPVTGLALHDPA